MGWAVLWWLGVWNNDVAFVDGWQVRGMECIRRLLRRSGEALRLLQLLQQHHVGRLAQSLDQGQRVQLGQLTFHQLVCSGDGEQIATRLVAALMEVVVERLHVP